MVADYDKVHQAYGYCNQYGLGSISTGTVLAFALECAKAGLLKEGQGKLTAKADAKHAKNAERWILNL
jgi:aldehyde:ferredoxin oxidoreductase